MDCTVHPELSLPGLHADYKNEILAEENRKLRQDLRRSRSVLGTPVQVRVAEAGFGLTTRPATHHQSRGGRRSPRSAENKLHHLGRAWRTTGEALAGDASFSEDASITRGLTVSRMATPKRDDTGGEWKLRYLKIERLVKMVLRPSLAACRAEAEELRQRNGEVEKNLLRATSELDELRPRLAQHELELKALRARLPNLPPRDWGTNTELEWPGAAAERHREMAAKLEKDLFAAQKELKELTGSHAEEKKKRRDAEKDLLALKLSTVDAGKHAAVETHQKETLKQLQTSRDNEARLREMLEEERGKASMAEAELDEAERRMDQLEDELAEMKKMKQKAWAKMSEDKKEAERIEQASHSKFTEKLLGAVSELRLAVVAPNVSVNVSGAPARALAKVPPASIEKCLEEEVLPSFVRVFSQNTRDKPLAELLELGKKKAPTECEWLMDHVEDIRAAVERALDNANVL